MDIVVDWIVYYFKNILFWHILLGGFLAYVIGPSLRKIDENMEKELRDKYEPEEDSDSNHKGLDTSHDTICVQLKGI